jgi:hypothetical protein
VLADFTSEISTDISSLGVDTTTDTTEEGNSGATKTVSRDKLEKDLDLMLNLCLLSLFAKTANDGLLEDKDEDFQDTESKTNKDEAEDLTTVEGSHETIIDALVAKVGYLDVGGGSDHHADVAGKHGGEGTDKEAERSVGETRVAVGFLPGLVNGTHENDSEEDAEDGEVEVFFLEEGFGTLDEISY